jgi:hypothetical protein
MAYDNTTKSDVLSAFTYTRQLMRDFNELTKTATEFDNDSELGQLVNELIANASVAQMYLDTQLAKQHAKLNRFTIDGRK